MKLVRWILVFILFFLMYKFIDKEGLIRVIDQSLPPREAGLLNGMLLGDKRGFEKNFYSNLKRTGIVHVVVVSGSNVILIAGGLIENLAKFLGRKGAIILSLVSIWAYSMMVGWEAPVVRAVLLISIFYWAQLIGRKFSWKRSLGLAVIIMVLANWRVVTSVSFWLSLTAFVAVTIKPRKLRGDFLKTFWVSLWVTPILAFCFGEISIVAPLVNALVLFLTETVTIVGGLGAILGLFWPFLGRVLLLLIYPLLKYFIFLVDELGKWAWISIKIR